jgi:hypothetical protein
MEQLHGLRDLTFHQLHLVANAIGRLVEDHVEIEETGFQIAERLAEIVNKSAEDLFRSGTHGLLRQGSV